MNDNLTIKQRQRLADFDTGIAAFLETPLTDDRIMRNVERRLRWRNTIRTVVPSALVAALAVYLAPTLLTLLQQVLPLVPGDMINLQVDLDTALQALVTMPVYIWAVLAGAGLTLVTTLLES